MILFGQVMNTFTKTLMLLKNTADYTFSEEVTHLEHALQTYYLLSNQTRPLRVAGFLHDIGHSLVLDDTEDLMDYQGNIVGVHNHDKCGVELLSPFLGKDITDLIGLHTEAKRYRGATDNLSLASRMSLACEGGEMTETEKSAFELHPLFLKVMILRDADDNAKNIKFDKDLYTKLLLSAIIDTLDEIFLTTSKRI